MFGEQRSTERIVRVIGRRWATLERNDPHAQVLIVTSGWPHDRDPAYGIFIRRQVDAAAARGVRMDVVVIRGYRSRLAYPAATLLLSVLNLRRSAYSLVHAHGGEAALAARLYVRAPLLASYLGDDLLGTPRLDASFPISTRIRRAIIRMHSLLTNATITKSAEMQAALPALTRRRNLILPNGVDRKAFSPVARSDARQRLGWPIDEPVVLFVGNPGIPRKRYPLAEAACGYAQRRISGLRLHVVNGVPPDHLPLLMSAADCLLLTSSVEGSPNVVKEALMCDLPVIATRVGDVSELLEGVEPSFVVEADPDELGKAVLRCLEQAARSNGRARSTWLSSEAITERLVRLYSDLGVPVDGRDRGGADHGSTRQS